MLTFEQTVTVYCQWKNKKEVSLSKKTLVGVSATRKDGVTINVTGLRTDDQYIIRIPEKLLSEYIEPLAWNSSESLPTGWTIQSGDVVVIGAAEDSATSIGAITSKYQTDCFVVKSVTNNRRIALKHLKVVGK